MTDDDLRRERERIVQENDRRLRELPADRYAPWDPAEQFMVQGRRLAAARLLHRLDLFPQPGTPILEVGCGEGGWLIDLLGWRIPQEDLWGIEVDLGRARVAKKRLPSAKILVADGAMLPFGEADFGLVIVSTVFSSVLDSEIQKRLASEMVRVLKPGGALLFYDFAIDNPHNPHVRGVSKARLRELFPALKGEIRRVTLAPPLARMLAPRALWLAHLLEGLPFLRTHWLALLRR